MNHLQHILFLTSLRSSLSSVLFEAMGSGHKFDSTYLQLPLFNIHRSGGGVPRAATCYILLFVHSFIHSFSFIHSLLHMRRKGRVGLVQCKRWSVRDACAAVHRRGRSPVAYPAVCPLPGRPSSIDLRPPLHSPFFLFHTDDQRGLRSLRNVCGCSVDRGRTASSCEIGVFVNVV